MQKLIIISLLIVSVLLGGCSWFSPYQPSIQQGNLVSEKMLSQLRIGMSKEQVVYTLGNPTLSNAFNNNHWAYVYTFQKNGGPITKKRLDLYFQNNHLIRIDRDYPAE